MRPDTQAAAQDRIARARLQRLGNNGRFHRLLPPGAAGGQDQGKRVSSQAHVLCILRHRVHVRMKTRMLGLFLFALKAAYPAVTGIEIIDRHDVLGGEAQGEAGPYERIVAKVHFAVDPALAQNRIVADVGLAPKNARGLVEFSVGSLHSAAARLCQRERHRVLEISNRGGKGLLGTFDFASGAADPHAPAVRRPLPVEAGLHAGLDWLGIRRAPPRPGVLRLVRAGGDGSWQAARTGLVRSEWIGDQPTKTISLGDMNRSPTRWPIRTRPGRS